MEIKTIMDGESMGGLIGMIGSLLGMIVVHGLLLIIHHSGASRPRSGNPSPAELCFGIALFWAFQRCIGRILLVVRGILAVGLSEFARRDGGLEVKEIGDAGLGWIWDDITSISGMVMITWSLHLALVFVLYTGIPFWRELRQNPLETLREVTDRSREILGFLETTFEDPFSTFSDDIPGAISEEILETRGQVIYLQRRQTDYPNEGERRLSWNIVVDKDAMNEMKETLGPPGGFGELGFNVARDGVRFEAMGVGTSFNLMFKLRGEEEDRYQSENSSTRKHK